MGGTEPSPGESDLAAGINALLDDLAARLLLSIFIDSGKGDNVLESRLQLRWSEWTLLTAYDAECWRKGVLDRLRRLQRVPARMPEAIRVFAEMLKDGLNEREQTVEQLERLRRALGDELRGIAWPVGGHEWDVSLEIDGTDIAGSRGSLG